MASGHAAAGWSRKGLRTAAFRRDERRSGSSSSRAKVSARSGRYAQLWPPPTAGFMMRRTGFPGVIIAWENQLERAAWPEKKSRRPQDQRRDFRRGLLESVFLQLHPNITLHALRALRTVRADDRRGGGVENCRSCRVARYEPHRLRGRRQSCCRSLAGRACPSSGSRAD